MEYYNENTKKCLYIAFILIVLNASTILAKDTKLKITEQPVNQYTRMGGVVEFSCTVNKKGVKYQWYCQNENKKNRKIKGAKKRTLKVLATDKVTKNRYFCKISDKSGRKITTKKGRIFLTDKNTENLTNDVTIPSSSLVIRTKKKDGYCYITSMDKKYVKQIKTALKYLNNAVGNTFIYTDTLEIADIVIVTFYNKKTSDDGVYTYYPVKGVELLDSQQQGLLNTFYMSRIAGTALIRSNVIAMNTYYLWSNKTIMHVVLHELGHCLGLKHTTDSRSIMYPTSKNFVNFTSEDISNFMNAKRILTATII